MSAVCAGPLREAQTTNCEAIFGVEASDQLIGDRVLPRGLSVAPNDKYPP
jgi:hypothetical protein